ncbi:hypothetical protein LRAMOSA01828 [Lichtheimia ramosa]|uniref:Uncharacterized protein n=1 Tax=Lichtheimia ramosa TaxID=688394 RepID=A0A077WL82_9FUNG|nr:hypothetical protein LRAMOSA01828 [Lichtheimia ramosa]
MANSWYLDITTCKIKYEEGFANMLGHIYTKPEPMWTKADQALVIPTEYSICLGFSMQTGTLLLLQCFWNYLANSVAKASFMSSKEFMLYIVWTVLSIIMFPVLQYNFSRDVYDPTYKEIMPELVYGCELLIVAILGVVSHVRFHKLLRNSRESNNARSITHKIRYFQELNLILTTVLFTDSISFIILSIDGLTAHKTLNMHKFSADFFICIINVSSVVAWFVVILIFHPKPQCSTNNTTNIAPPTQDFLSTEKPPFEYNGSGIMVIQQSQASEEFMHYTKSGSVVVPMTNQPSYASNTNFQLNPRSSTVTLVTNQKPAPANDDMYKPPCAETYSSQPPLMATSSPPVAAIPPIATVQPSDNSNDPSADCESAIDYPLQHDMGLSLPPHQNQQQPHDDWLHQCPRSGSIVRSP